MKNVSFEQMYLVNKDKELICPMCNKKLCFNGWSGNNPDEMTDIYYCPVCSLRAYDDGDKMTMHPMEKIDTTRYSFNPLVTIYINAGYTRIETNDIKKIREYARGYTARHNGRIDWTWYSWEYNPNTFQYYIFIIEEWADCD